MAAKKSSKPGAVKYFNDLKEQGFGIISRNELVIDKRKIESIPDIFKDWLKPITVMQKREERLKELGIV